MPSDAINTNSAGGAATTGRISSRSSSNYQQIQPRPIAIAPTSDATLSSTKMYSHRHHPYHSSSNSASTHYTGDCSKVDPSTLHTVSSSASSSPSSTPHPQVMGSQLSPALVPNKNGTMCGAVEKEEDTKKGNGEGGEKPKGEEVGKKMGYPVSPSANNSDSKDGATASIERLADSRMMVAGVKQERDLKEGTDSAGITLLAKENPLSSLLSASLKSPGSSLQSQGIEPPPLVGPARPRLSANPVASLQTRRLSPKAISGRRTGPNREKVTRRLSAPDEALIKSLSIPREKRNTPPRKDLNGKHSGSARVNKNSGSSRKATRSSSSRSTSRKPSGSSVEGASEGESDGRMASGSRDLYNCTTCSKKYKNRSSLAKHEWEHHSSWVWVSKEFSLTKHEQVKLMEDANDVYLFWMGTKSKILE
eukprot:Nk52_evm37s279 gene=Nk52_evmTU37s279